MDYILIISVILRLIAALWSAALYLRLSDWRLLFPTILFSLMASRQLLTLFGPTHLEPYIEIPALFTSILGLWGLYLGYRYIRKEDRFKTAIVEAEKKYNTLVESGNDGIIVIQDGLLKYINRQMEQLAGFSREEVLGTPFLDYVAPDFREFVQENYQARMAGREAPGRYEIDVLKKDGLRIPAEVNASRIEFEGSPADMAILRDISDRKQAEETIRNSNELISMAGEMAKVGGWEFDAETLKGTWTPEVARIHDVDPELETNVEIGLSFFSPESRPIIEEALREARLKGTPYDLELDIISAKGVHKWVRTMGVPVTRDGKIVKVRGIIQDISDRKTRENSLVRSNRALNILSRTNQILLHATDESQLLQELCTLIVEDDLYSFSWIGFAEHDASKTVKPVAFCGFEEGYLDLLNVTWSEQERGRGPTGTAIRSGEPSVFKSISIPDFKPWQEAAEQRGYASVIALPLIADDQAFGALTIYSLTVDAFNNEEVKLLNELAANLSFGILALRYRAERDIAETRLETYLDSAPDGVYISDVNGTFIYGNKIAEKICGYSKEELIGKNYLELKMLDPAYVEKALSLLRLNAAGIATGPDELRFRRKDGSYIDVEISTTPVQNNGEYAVIAVVRDISKRLESEEILRFSATALASLHESVIAMDDEFIVTLWNENCEEMFGIPASEAIGRNIIDLLDILEDYPGQNDERIKTIRATGFYRDEQKIMTPKGEVWVDVHSQAIEDKGKRYGWVNLMEDITERKHAEDALRESEAKLRITLASIPQGVTVTDLDRRVIQANSTKLKMHGFESEEEVIGRSALDFIVRDDRERAKEIRERIDSTGSSISGEYTLVRKDGTTFPGILTSAVIKDTTGQTIGYVTVTEDVTERQKVEEQLVVTDRLASVGELAAGIAHELNNPLTGVIGFSEMLMERPDIPESIKGDLEIINREALRTAEVVRNLLTFARKHETRKSSVQVNEVIQNVLTLRTYEQRVNNITVNTTLAPDLPEIEADPFRLQQVFINIIINAEYFMANAHGRGTLDVTSRFEDDNLVITFTDDGPGISKENISHLFDPFFTTKEVGKGTGLGLSISHGIIVEHGGTISVESTEGKGTTFTITIPVK